MTISTTPLATCARGSDFGISQPRFNFACASAGITTITCSNSPVNNSNDSDTETVTCDEVKTQTPKLYQVIVIDDDYTSMEFVVSVLQNVFKMDLATAQIKTREIHLEGKAICGTYTCDIAETKADQVIELARARDFPLMAIVQPA